MRKGLVNPARVRESPSFDSMSTVQNFLRFTAPVSGSRYSRETPLGFPTS